MARKPPPRGKGGAREGSGRKPEWFVSRCQELFEKKKLLDFVANVAAGEEMEQRVVVVNDETVIEEVRPCTRDRLKATEMLKEWGFGKDLDVGDGKAIAASLGAILAHAASQRGLQG